MDKQVMLTFETLTCENLVFFMKKVSLCGKILKICVNSEIGVL